MNNNLFAALGLLGASLCANTYGQIGSQSHLEQIDEHFLDSFIELDRRLATLRTKALGEGAAELLQDFFQDKPTLGVTLRHSESFTSNAFDDASEEYDQSYALKLSTHWARTIGDYGLVIDGFWQSSHYDEFKQLDTELFSVGAKLFTDVEIGGFKYSPALLYRSLWVLDEDFGQTLATFHSLGIGAHRNYVIDSREGNKALWTWGLTTAYEHRFFRYLR